MKAEARIKIRTVESDLAALSRMPLANGAEQDAEQTIEVVRQGNGKSTKSIVDDDFALMPGDVVEVSLRAHQRSANSER
jgi:hypothetical protein